MLPECRDGVCIPLIRLYGIQVVLTCNFRTGRGLSWAAVHVWVSCGLPARSFRRRPRFGFWVCHSIALLVTYTDIWPAWRRLITFTICCAYVGIFFTMPLRRLYILKLKLTFPGAVAAAYTIRSLHVGRHAAANARKKTLALISSFLLAILWRIVSEYAPGIMWDWHWGWWFYKAGWKWIIAAENWVSVGRLVLILVFIGLISERQGWIWEWTPAFIGVGLLVPINSSFSFVGGSVLGWAIIGPALVATNRAFGIPASTTGSSPEYVNYANMVLNDPINSPSPKYWMIWPGCAILLCASMAEIAANGSAVARSIAMTLAPLVQEAKAYFLGTKGQTRGASGGVEEDAFRDPVPVHEQVPWWMWTGGLAGGMVLTMLVMKFQFGQNAGVTFLALLFSFLFSLVGAECTGRVSVTPVTTLGNFAQLVFGGVSKGTGLAPAANQLNNGLSGMITLGASEQVADMLGEYLLNRQETHRPDVLTSKVTSRQRTSSAHPPASNCTLNASAHSSPSSSQLECTSFSSRPTPASIRSPRRPVPFPRPM